MCKVVQANMESNSLSLSQLTNLKFDIVWKFKVIKGKKISPRRYSLPFCAYYCRKATVIFYRTCSENRGIGRTGALCLDISSCPSTREEREVLGHNQIAFYVASSSSWRKESRHIAFVATCNLEVSKLHLFPTWWIRIRLTKSGDHLRGCLGIGGHKCSLPMAQCQICACVLTVLVARTKICHAQEQPSSLGLCMQLTSKSAANMGVKIRLFSFKILLAIRRTPPTHTSKQ